MGFRGFSDLVVSLDELLAEAKRDPGGAAMQEVVQRFDRLIERIVFSFGVDDATRDDLRSEARLALVLAVGRHQAGRPGFARYAEISMRGAALRWLKAWKKRSGSDLDVVDEPAAKDPITMGWGDGEVADAVQELSERHQDLLRLRYVEDVELSVIADIHGVSVSAVSQQLRTVHNTIRLRVAA